MKKKENLEKMFFKMKYVKILIAVFTLYIFSSIPLYFLHIIDNANIVENHNLNENLRHISNNFYNVDIREIKDKIYKINKKQEIFNIYKFGNIKQSDVIIIIQVN